MQGCAVVLYSDHWGKQVIVGPAATALLSNSRHAPMMFSNRGVSLLGACGYVVKYVGRDVWL